ncbi:MAG: DUF2341 domain-containing protein [Candidatus Paceibacterota bacterium]|jgi:hypothetical protein
MPVGLALKNKKYIPAIIIVAAVLLCFEYVYYAGAASAPAQVAGLNATSGNTQISLSWTAPDNGGSAITNYRVYRSSPTNGSYSLLALGGCSSLGNTTICTDSGLANGTAYFYKVSAVNLIGEGPQSDEASAIPVGLGCLKTGGGSWLDSNWTKRKPIIISENSGSNLVDHQIKVTIAYDADMQSDFDDIRFTSSDGSTPIYYWLESKTDSSTADFWVKVPNVPAFATDTIYMYYGNAAASSVGSYDNTFTKDYAESGLVGLWHMDEAAGATVSDSSGSGNGGTMGGAPDNPIRTSSDGGQWDSRNLQFSAGNSLSFDGTNDYVSISPDNVFDGLTSGTFMAWVKANAGASGFDSIFTADSGNCTYPFEIAMTTVAGTTYFEVWGSANGDCNAEFDGYVQVSNPTNWHLVAYVVSGSGNEFYLDGVKQAVVNYDAGNAASKFFFNNSSSGTTQYYIGNSAVFGSEHPGEVFDGEMDEVRLYDRALSAGEISRYYLRSKYASPEPGVCIGAEEISADIPSILNITSPNGDSVAQGDVFGINYSLIDPDDIATAALYYDNDMNNANGYVGAIALCGSVPESAGAICNWNTAGIVPGNYYVYGVASDGVSDYSGMITIGTFFNYEISDMSDMVLTTGASATRGAVINLVQAPAQDVLLSYSISPSEPLIGISWSVGNVCQPDCTRTFDIDIDPSTPTGDYIIKITGQSAGLANKEKTFKLTVIPAAEYSNLYGFGWSDTIGWISFSSKDCDTDGDGTFEGALEDGGAAPANCPSLGTAFPYGARISTSTNDLSGYAWGENFGWVSFNWPDIKDVVTPPFILTECPNGGNCQARLDGNEFKGWARACSVFANNCTGPLRPPEERGGWDGWISLNCINDASCGTSNYKVVLAGSDLSGWGWSGLVGGWISFDGVKIRIGDNKPALWIFGQMGIDYCKKDLPGAVSLRWEYNDAEDGYGMQSAYEIELTKYDSIGNFVAECKPGKKNDNATNLLGTEINSVALCGANFIDYGGFTYIWKLRVYDSDNNINEGDFMIGDPFPDSVDELGSPNPSPDHQYPRAEFTYAPAGNILLFMPIVFDPSLSWSDDPPYTIDRYQWFFDYATNPVTPDAEAITPPPGYTETYSYPTPNVYRVDLRVRDSGGIECWAHDRDKQKDVNIMSNKPKWNEAAP